jgi:hypothetical protein
MGSTKLPMRSTKMNAKLQSQMAKSKEQALAAFVSKKAEIDAMLTRLKVLSDDHFGYAPDEITWSHVGTLEHYAELLKRITEMVFIKVRRDGGDADAGRAWVRDLSIAARRCRPARHSIRVPEW